MNFQTGKISAVTNGLVMTDWGSDYLTEYYFVYDGSKPLKKEKRSQTSWSLGLMHKMICGWVSRITKANTIIQGVS